MANIKSQIKRNKTNEKRRKLNHSYLSSMRTAIKKIDKAIENENNDELNKHYKLAISRIDKALKKGVIKKNTSSRKKSYVTKKVNQIINKQ